MCSDESAQAASEVLLLLGGILVIVLILVHIYKSYLSDFGSEIKSNELDKLDDLFYNLSSKFD